MDVSLRVYQNLDREQAKARIDKLVHECKSVGGTFVSLWHNSSFSAPDGWEGWKEVYEHLLKTAST